MANVSSHVKNKKLLFISGHLPTPESLEAGQKTAFRNLVNLSKEYELYLVSICNDLEKSWGHQALIEFCKEIHIVHINKFQKIISIFLHLNLPIKVAIRVNRRLEKTIENLIKKNKFKRVHFEWGETTYYNKLCKGIEIKTLDIIDVLFQTMTRYREKAKLLSRYWSLQEKLTKKWEAISYSHIDKIFTHSVKDINLLKTIQPGIENKCAISYPVFIEPKFSNEDLVEKRNESIHQENLLRILFWGALSRKENVEGALWLIEKVLPLVIKEKPYSIVYIVGANPPPKLIKMAGQNIVITGFVDDPSYYLINSSLAVFPLFAGAGVKVKVLEALRFGLPVLTTEIGAEGIPLVSEQGLFTLKPNQYTFAEKIIELCSDPKILFQLSKNAIECISKIKIDAAL